MENIEIKLLPNALAPTRMTDGSAGYDLYAYFPRGSAVMVHHVIVRTGVSLSIPRGYYGRIAPRSSLAANHGIYVMGGVIDSDYRGEISVILGKHSSTGYEIKNGDRIAQLIIERCYHPSLSIVDKLDKTERGTGKFGSTGK